MPKALGVAYIVAQCIGAFLASILLIFFTDNTMQDLSVVRHCFALTSTGEKTNTVHNCAVGVEGTNYYDQVWYTRAMA